MIGKNDKLITVKLYTSHDSDYICERPDGTRYVFQKRKNSSEIYELNEDKNDLDKYDHLFESCNFHFMLKK